MRVSKNGVVGEVTGIFGLLDNISDLGEAKRDNKRGNRKDKKSCSSDHESKASCKKNDNKKKCCPRKASVSACSDDSHSVHKSNQKRGRSEGSCSKDSSDSKSKSSCSKKSDKGKRRKLAECEGSKFMKPTPRMLA